MCIMLDAGFAAARKPVHDKLNLEHESYARKGCKLPKIVNMLKIGLNQDKLDQKMNRI